MKLSRFAAAAIWGFVLNMPLGFARAEDLVTLDGNKYVGITDISKYPKQVFFTYGTNRIAVALTNLPDDFEDRHGILTINVLLKRANAGDSNAMVAVGDDWFKKWQTEFSNYLKTNKTSIDPNTDIDPNTGLPIGNGLFCSTNSLNYRMSIDWYRKAALMGNTNAMWRIVEREDFTDGDFVQLLDPNTGLPLAITKGGFSWLKELAKRGDSKAIDRVNTINSPRPPRMTLPSSVADFEVLDVRAKVTEANDTWWRWSYQLKARNNTLLPVEKYLHVDFLDADGFIIDHETCHVRLSAFETKTFLGTDLIDLPGAERVKSVKAELFP
jgi:hypothetical protein